MAIPTVFRETPVYRPPVLERVDRVDDFWAYHGWQEDRTMLPIYIINPFKASVHNHTGFTGENPPQGETEQLIKCGDIEFNVTSKKAARRPRYADIYGEFVRFVDELITAYERSRLREGYRIFEVDGMPQLYLSVSLLLEKLGDDVATMLSEKEGVNHKIVVVGPADLIEYVPERLTIVSDTDYSAWTPYNARMYAEAGNMRERGDINTGFKRKKGVSRFKRLLLEDSFERLGDKPTVLVKVPYPFGAVTFLHHIKPEATPRYEAIINALLKPVPSRLQRNSAIGDLRMAEAMRTEDLPEKLREKGLWDEEFVNTYDPRLADGMVYVNAEGLSRRLPQLKSDKTSTTYNQSVSVKPTRRNL